MVIKTITKSSYGHLNQYIADPAIASAVMGLTGRKTITATHRACLEALGFTFEEVLQPK